jgi:hypothetical protein
LIASLNKAGNWSSTRNRIVHGDMLIVEFLGSRLYGQCIILEGSEFWDADILDEDIMTKLNLEIASENFGRLAFCLISGLNWDGKDQNKSPARFLVVKIRRTSPSEIAERLPKVPTSRVSSV